MRCRDATVLLSKGLDTKIGLWDQARLRLHLRRCAACRNLARAFGFLRQSGEGVAKRAA